MQLYDYIYVDLDKAISLYSQLTGGVVEMREIKNESGSIANNKRNYDFKVFKHDAGGSITDMKQSKEVIKPYHSFLIELEKLLEEQGHLVTVNSETKGSSFKAVSFRRHVRGSFAMKVSGRCVVEDYERIKVIGQAFPDIVALINKSSESNIKESEEYKELSAQIEELESTAKDIKDRNKRSEANQIVKRQKKALADLVAISAGVESPERWILDGLKTWVDTFLPGIVNLRVYPSVDRPDEHVCGNLKREYFCDSNSSSFHFTYGSFPTGDITVVGVVASVPEKGGEKFNPLEEFSGDSLADTEAVENGFRGLFRGFDGLEQMIRTCRFPRVMLYPVLVYRTAIPNKRKGNDD